MPAPGSVGFAVLAPGFQPRDARHLPLSSVLRLPFLKFGERCLEIARVEADEIRIDVAEPDAARPWLFWQAWTSFAAVALSCA